MADERLARYGRLEVRTAEVAHNCLRSVNPANGEVIDEYPLMSVKEIDNVIAESHDAFEALQTTTLHDRATMLRSIATVLREHSDGLARLVALEVGKPINQAQAEISKSARVAEFYATQGLEWLSEQVCRTEASESFVTMEPQGIVLAIMPWNFPVWQVFRCAIPALATGNAVVVKHAPSTTGCALEVERLCREGGLPAGALSVLRVAESTVPHVVRDDRVCGVAFTGSVRGGRAVASLAGRWLKRSVLELGGSDAMIVCRDADVDVTLENAVVGRFEANGQDCTAPKRILVVSELYEEFVGRLAGRVSELVVGDPLRPNTDVGPLHRRDLRATVSRQVREAASRGARVEYGGEVMPGDGWFYTPTVLADVVPDMRAFDEEVFGPVACVTSVASVDEAVTLANASTYGLGGSVWTRDVEAGVAIARRIKCGTVFVNAMTRSDPRLPFGGVKRSGVGRELGEYGLAEFANVKSYWVGTS